MVEEIVPSGAFLFRGKVPGDKSITHRALLIGALGRGETRTLDPLVSADTDATAEVLRALGVPVSRGPGAWSVTGVPFTSPKAPLDCKNSGTTVRLLLGILAGRGVKAVITGDASLRRRPMARIVDPLRKMGAAITYLERGGVLPLRLEPAPLIGTTHTLTVASAQVKSAIILAGLAARGRTVVLSPRPTRDHTERLLLGIHAPLDRLERDEGEGWIVDGPAELGPLGEVAIPGDPSSAAFLWAAAAVTGGRAETLGVLLNRRRTGFLEVLERAGVHVARRLRVERPEPIGDVVVEGPPTRAVEIGPGEVPDLIDELPVAAAVMVRAPGVSRVWGAEELRVKESDRIATTARGLLAMGARIDVAADGWTIFGGHRLQGGRVESEGDHRIAMALAVAGLAARGPTAIGGAECVQVSFPGFFDLLKGAPTASV